MSNTTNLNLFKHDNPEQNTNAFDVEEALNKNWDKIDTYAGNVNEDITEINSAIESISGDISDIQTEQTTQNNKISALETDNTTNKTNIATLQTDSGHSILLELNTTTYVLTATLKNKAGTILNTSSIDLPVEQLVVSVSYDENTKELVITLKNGEVTRVSLGDLISGLQTEITSSNKLSSDLVDDTNNTNKFVTTGEKQGWNAKYNKPSGGIPKTDLADEVQTSLGKADTALQQHQDISGKEDKSNKVTSIDDTSTDEQYPSAKSVYDSQKNQDENIETLQEENKRLKQTLVTTTGTGETITLNKTAELDFVIPPLPEGNTKQNTTEGYQLIELADFASFTNNGITFTKLDDGGIKVNGTSTSQAYINLLTGDTSVSNNPRNITLLADEYYTLSGSSSTLELMIHTSGYSKVHQAKGSNVTFKETSDVSISTVRINVNSGVTINNEIIYPMLEKGSTAHDFEKYTNGASPNPSYEQEVQVVKGDVEVDIINMNFLPNNGTTQSINGVNYTVNSDKSVLAKGTANTNNSDFYLVGDQNNYEDLKLKEGTYNFAGCSSGSGSTYMLFMVKKDINDSITYHISTTTNGLVVNISKGDTFRIFIRVLPGVSINETFYPQLVLEPSPYTPHKEQKLPLALGNIELCKIGDYQDFPFKAIDGDDYYDSLTTEAKALLEYGKWYLHKETGKVVLDGTNYVSRGTTGTNAYYLSTSIQGLNNNDIEVSYSNMFQPCSFSARANGKDITYSQNGYINLRTANNTSIDWSDETACKNWLNANTPKLVYILPEPIDIEITDTTLINQLEAIYNAISYEEQTNISGTSNGISPLFDVEAYQNTKLILENALDRLELLES